jgi:hypothetical protein
VTEEIVELNRVTSNFASKMQERGQQIEGTLRSFAAAVDAAADRLAGAVRPGPAPAPPAGPTGVPPTLQLVRVVNDQSAPIPVVMVQDLVTPATKQEAPKSVSDRILNFVTGGLPSGIGSFFGSVFGGFAGAVVSGVTALWGGLAAGVQLITILAQVGGLIREVGSTAEAILQAVKEAVGVLFDRLEKAGILPADTLRDTLLTLLERGLALVYAQARPILDWVSKLLTALGTWLGKFVTNLGSWLTRIGNTLSRHITVLVEYLFDAVLRPKVHVLLVDLVAGLGAVFLGVIQGLGTVLIEGGKYFGLSIAHAVMGAVDRAAQRLGLPPGTVPVPSPPPTFEPGKILERAFSQSRYVARELAESVLGPPPVAPGVAPRLRLPAFAAPALVLPAAPAAGGEAAAAPIPAPKPAAGVPGVAPVTLNGGVNVQITAETIDIDNAESTARRIAAHVLDELERLTELQRFRRGLPTEAVS